jgi:hypothetical protein
MKKVLLVLLINNNGINNNNINKINKGFEINENGKC